MNPQQQPPYAQMTARTNAVQPAQMHGGASAHQQQQQQQQQKQQQFNNSTKGAGRASVTGQMGGVQFKADSRSGNNYLGYGLAAVQWGLVIFLTVGAIWFYVRLPQEGYQDVILQGFHSKHHRLFIQRNMVNVYNHTTLGLAVFQGGLLIGSPTIPGSGLLIVNKRNNVGQMVNLEHLQQHVVEETEDHLYVHDTDGSIKSDVRKRGVDAYSPVSLYSGINIRDQSNIAMNGGDIIGVDTIVASEIFANVRSQKNASSAQTAQISVGMAVGFQINGSVGLGFAQNPEASEPLVVQSYYLNDDDADQLAAVRFNEQKFAVFYLNASAGALVYKVGTVDANNRATYQSGPGSVILNAGVLGTDMFACSLEEEDGTGASTVLVVYKSAINNALYARVCDLSVPTAPVCGPSTNTSLGDAGVNGVLVYSATGIVLQSLTCLTHPSDGALTTKRWFAVAWTDSVSGLQLAQQIQANVALPLPVSTVATATRIVGIVNNLTDTSTSTDLAGFVEGSIAVERLQGGNFVTFWRTGASHNQGKFEVDYINETALEIQLATRSPVEFVTSYDNLGVETWVFDVSVSQREPYLIGGYKQTIYVAYNIGPSVFGELFFSTLAVPASAAAPIGASPWITSGTIEFSNDVNPQYTYSFPNSAQISVEGICSNQALVSYVSGGVGVAQVGYTVLVNMAPTQACVDAGICGSVSTRAPYSSSVPYLGFTMWRTLASDGFDCSSDSLSTFVTVFSAYADIDYYNTTIFGAPGVAGEYTVSYAPLDTPRQVMGVVSAVYGASEIVSYITTGEINICYTTYTIDGRQCPFEAPAPVYSCPSGHLTFSPYCADADVNSPSQLVGYTDIWGNLQVQPQVQNAF